jgi:hypothetical protein
VATALVTANPKTHPNTHDLDVIEAGCITFTCAEIVLLAKREGNSEM